MSTEGLVLDENFLETERILKEENNLRKYGNRRGEHQNATTPESTGFFDDCEKDLQFLIGNLATYDETTRKMIQLLGSLENRLTQLRAEINPIHADTTRLKNVHYNDIMDIFDTSLNVEQKIKEGFVPSSPADVDQYLGRMDKIIAAMNFLSIHKNFRSAEKATNQLKALRDVAIGFCDQGFVHLLIRDSIPLDLTKFNDPDVTVPESIPLIQLDGVVEMKKLIQRFKEFGTGNYVREYKERRGKLMVAALRKMGPERTVKDEGQTKYDHPYILFFRVAFMLLRTEGNMCSQLFGSEQREQIYFELIAPCIELIMETGEALIKAKKNMDKGFGVFSLTDVWFNLKNILREDSAPLGGGTREPNGVKYFEEFRDLAEKCGTAGRKCLEKFEGYVSEDIKTLPSDATIHELTSNCCVFFRRIVALKPKIESLLSDKSYVSNFLGKTVTELKNNLNGKARSKKESNINPTVFLLNNYFYILKTIQVPEISAHIPNARALSTEFDSLITEQHDNYRATWNRAMESILLESTNVNKSPTSAHIGKKDKRSIKKNFSVFNEEWEKNCEDGQAQKSCSVPDDELRKKLTNDLKQSVGKIYQTFYNTYANTAFTKNKAKYVRFSVEDVLKALDKFFEGDPTAQPYRTGSILGNDPFVDCN
ncbi:hypothetical protein PROFUN_03895 [Planoprotostelium fungivorum]|uniref:Exocyst subunit Exo70 family protein n=1 Tax=Planoprotostelium fungivorum TaxID=1890364 RepID=A0A2P6MTM0_9EUKA|nr:hypothetical protein PROFUN_03895 [Planoprotostelium fungivorum]